ncbi:tyrosine-type recombinase/integrase [Duganella sp. FT135W]|uniref:Tyrosine-type recombinase/integrase n=2 Tax=Duganella flavida TaxID=2692175 RepID=A0A6L8KGB0_9BURK|nr:tyrosine-type recombinase/integrase [Duganella flavida]
MNKLLAAVTLFSEYFEKNVTEEDLSDGKLPHWKIFSNFSNALSVGTFDLNTGLDPSYLCWSPRDHQSQRHVILLLTDFFEWMSNTYPEVSNFNPKFTGGLYEIKMKKIAYEFRRSRAFLGHLWDDNPKEEIPLTSPINPGTCETGTSYEFPDEKFEELIFKGFKYAGKYNYRDILITLLLHGAGFRSCEPFHLFVEDVNNNPNDPTSSLVCIHHPQFGSAPAMAEALATEKPFVNRQAYLAHYWGMLPRNRIGSDYPAGWKNPKLDEKHYMRAYWYSPEYGQWFKQFWDLYMLQLASIERHHPFAFVNINRDPIGQVYSLENYYSSHESAVRRIGLPYGKQHGTTAHGHRHSYGRRLRRAGFDPLFIQKFMHHKSVESQKIYTEPSTEEALEMLEMVSKRQQSFILLGDAK